MGGLKLAVHPALMSSGSANGRYASFYELPLIVKTRNWTPMDPALTKVGVLDSLDSSEQPKGEEKEEEETGENSPCFRVHPPPLRTGADPPWG